MVEDTQNPTSLQPTGTTNGDTNNPQQLPQVGDLQPQANAQLQPTTVTSPTGLAALDQSTTTIKLSTVSTTTSIPAQPATTSSQSSSVALYALVAVVCLAAVAYMVRGLLKHRA